MGALDLNADFFKTKMKIFDPSLLTDKQKENILGKFETLNKRQIQDYENEYKQKDRIAFDEEILTQVAGINPLGIYFAHFHVLYILVWGLQIFS